MIHGTHRWSFEHRSSQKGMLNSIAYLYLHSCQLPKIFTTTAEINLQADGKADKNNTARTKSHVIRLAKSKGDLNTSDIKYHWQHQGREVGVGRFKNAHELLNLGVLSKFQCCIKITFFNVWEGYFVWNFKGNPPDTFHHYLRWVRPWTIGVSIIIKQQDMYHMCIPITKTNHL